jgi:hypothetical protein
MYGSATLSALTDPMSMLEDCFFAQQTDVVLKLFHYQLLGA